MARRFEGFGVDGGLFVLDTYSGEVRFVAAPTSAVAAVAAVPLPAVVAAAAASIAGPAPVPTAASASGADAPDGGGSPERAAGVERGGPGGGLELPPEIDDLDREVVLTYPYPVARPYLDLLKERDPRMRCKLLVDTFTSVLKVWALIVASEYLRAPDVKDAQVHKTMVRDLARPLISAWSLLLQRALVVLRDARVTPFAPELGRAFEALETRCRQRFLVTETYVDDAGVTQTRTKKLGKIQALIAYRNGLAHGFNQSSKQAQRDLDTYLPLLREVLREARFLARYPLWYVVEGRRGAEEAVGHRLMGARPPASPEAVDAAELDPRISPLFMKNEASGEVLPLFAFFDVHEVEDGGLPGLGRDIFLFEGNTKRTVIYVSVTGEHAEKASRFQHWQALLAAKAVDVELLSADTLSLDALRVASRRIADQAIEALVSSGKYLREASIDRADLEQHLGPFEYGRFGAFVLGGESGIGKSTLLARYVERRREAGDAVVFYRASALPGADVGARMLRDLGLAGMYLEDFHAAAAPLFQEGARLLLVVDAVNEFGGDVAELVRQLDQLVQQSAGHDWFRVVVSVRDSAYQRLPADARFGARGLSRYYTVEDDVGGQKVRTPLVGLRPLGQEHVQSLFEAYRGYRQKDPDDPESPGLHRFRPLTPWSELAPEGSTRALLRSPLMARLVMEAFHRRALPSDLRSDQAMRLYLDHVVVESGAPSGGFPARRRLLQALVREFDRASVDTLPRDQLSGVAALRAELLNAQRDSAYVQLVDLGVLLEEWEGETCLVRFAFDRLFEFLLAELHDPRVQSADEALALAARAAGFRSLRGALEAILGRACEQGREALLIELIDRSAGASDTVARQVVDDLAVSQIVRMAREKESAFGRILAAMSTSPSTADVDVLGGAALLLQRTGDVEPLDQLLPALLATAEVVGDAPRLAGALLRRGQRAWMLGQAPAAIEAFERARSIGEQAGERLLVAEALRSLGTILVADGKPEDATRLLLASVEHSRAVADPHGEAESLRALGVIAKRRKDLPEAERMNVASLAVARASGDDALVARALNNLAMLAVEGGRLEEADRLLDEALSHSRPLGIKRSVAVQLVNRGMLHELHGRAAASEASFRESLELARELNDAHLFAHLLNAFLGLLAGEGRLTEEAALVEEALTRASSVDSAAVRILAANAGVYRVLAAPDSDAAALTSALELLRERHRGANNDVAEGPATPLFAASRWLSARGDAPAAAGLAAEALEAVRGRPWPHRAAAERLAAAG